ncbi:MAG: preprotein translocase subunit SecA [Burkholderiales bacterium RIFCSPLOWO2_12_FULL_61_40]|nr:MAG: preprotein translocase subunit SecA [Burkholderiales bacterium RIFCSPLOWO2_12_FULL_61_40]
MSDVRALVVGRGIEVGDGVYHERAEPPHSVLEEILRAWASRFAMGGAGRAQAFLKRANALESIRLVEDDQTLRGGLQAVAQQMCTQGFVDELLAQAFSFVREGSRRVLGMRHHDVQLLAGRALLQGKIAEMATGEGKTLAATLAACTAAAAGAAVHVVTVNDYLGARDAEKNAPLFTFFEFTLGVVVQDMSAGDRRKQYGCHIVYVSNKELTFDYLKDRISVGGVLKAHQKLRRLHSPHGAPQTILRGLHVAIVDEADSVLIDEARTPLIISETLPDDLDEVVYQQAIALAGSLVAEADYVLTKDRDIWLTQAGYAKVQSLSSDLGGVWKSPLWQKELVQKALSALHSFHRDEHYIIAENKVQIVDEFTGRVMPDRTWERGLHQMIEAKENCEITGQRKTLQQITYQRFFGRYLLLAGMTGTAKEVELEIKRVYDLSAVRIPTHKPSKRIRLADRVFHTSEERWQAVANRAAEVAAGGRSVLVGTRSVEASETLGRLLEELGVAHTVLNARQDKTEADAIEHAGQPGRITVATNMAGRGTDIKLSPEVEAKGGLHVILTEFHESARIDRQLFGRSARQGDPGTTEAIVCLQDELFVRYIPSLSALIAPWCVGSSRRSVSLFRWVVIYAQANAERKNRHIRLDTIGRDRKWQQALGFVGITKK